MKHALPLILLFASSPVFAAGVPASCADSVKTEVTRSLNTIREFTESRLTVKQVSSSFTGQRDNFGNVGVLTKVYFATDAEDDPANWERYKFTTFVKMGGAVVAGGQGCQVVTTATKTLR